MASPAPPPPPLLLLLLLLAPGAAGVRGRAGPGQAEHSAPVPEGMRGSTGHGQAEHSAPVPEGMRGSTGHGQAEHTAPVPEGVRGSTGHGQAEHTAPVPEGMRGSTGHGQAEHTAPVPEGMRGSTGHGQAEHTAPVPAGGQRQRRGTEDSRAVQQYGPGVRVEFPRPLSSGSLQPTRALLPSSTDAGVPTERDGPEPRANLSTVSDRRLQMHNPLYPVTEGSYSAYAVVFLSLVVFTVGIVANLAVMCIVWHNYYMKSAWNSILASLAFWDFLILFFCLPVVIFNEITKKRLLGDVSCRIVPFMEVSSLGVTTFSLCALGIDRFHAATSPQASTRPIEQCQSIIAKLAVIWVGSMTLSVPEILLWQLARDTSPVSGVMSEFCAMKPSSNLPESIYSLVLTYQNARMWWYFGCYFCLPVLFTVSCQLVTRRVRGPDKKGESRGSKQGQAEGHLNCTIIALTVIYGLCTTPENVCNIVVAYMSPDVSKQTLDLLNLINQFFLFFKCSVTPVLLLCLCRPLGQAFMDCCCCCCEGCGPDGSSSESSADSKLKTEMSSSIFFDKPRETPPPLLALGTPC